MSTLGAQDPLRMKASGEERGAGKRHSSEGTTLWAPGWGFSPPYGKEEGGRCQLSVGQEG